MIDIRKAEEKDLGSLRAIYDQIGQKDPGYFETSLELQDKGERDLFIASLKGQDVGFCILNFKPQYSLYKKLEIPEIQDLNVVPDVRRQGVASALVAICEDRASGKGRNQIGVSVGLSAVYGPAQVLYHRLGYCPDGHGITYRRQGVQHGQMHPVDDDLCLMLVKDI